MLFKKIRSLPIKIQSAMSYIKQAGNIYVFLVFIFHLCYTENVNTQHRRRYDAVTHFPNTQKALHLFYNCFCACSSRAVSLRRFSSASDTVLTLTVAHRAIFTVSGRKSKKSSLLLSSSAFSLQPLWFIKLKYMHLVKSSHIFSCESFSFILLFVRFRGLCILLT